MFENHNCMQSSKITFDAFPCNLSENWGTKKKSTSNQPSESLPYDIFMQNTQKLNMLGCTDQNVCPETYGGHCTLTKVHLHMDRVIILQFFTNYISTFWSVWIFSIQLQTDRAIILKLFTDYLLLGQSVHFDSTLT